MKTDPNSEGIYRGANPTAVRLYDITDDTFRDVTQNDVDKMQEIVSLYFRIPADLRDLYRPAVRGDGIGGTDGGEICGELSEGV